MHYSILQLLLAAGVAGGILDDFPTTIVKPEVAAERVASCGIGTPKPTFNQTLQEDVIEISGIESASDGQLRCVASASLETYYYVVLPAALNEKYQAIYWAISKERDLANARRWLEERGLSAKLPTYDPNNSDEMTFVRKLEAMCGAKAEGAIKPLKGFGTFSEGVLSSGRLDKHTWWCLINGAAVSGYPFGFIGNEQYSTDR